MTAQRNDSDPTADARQSRPGDPFLDPRLHMESLDNWLIRTAILRVLRENVPASDGGMLLDVGCGHQPYRPVLETQMGWRYVGVDIPITGYSPPDVFWDGLRLPFRADSVSALMLTEVLEHCPEPSLLLAEARRVMRPGATAVATTPFLWPLHDVPYDVARYSPFTLKRLFEEAGFTEVRVWSTGGWHQALAQMLGLWVRRGPMSERKRALMSRMLVPVVRSLARRQPGPVTDFHESQMPTTLAIVAS
jgi:SAM-dependent methyltransferase